MIPHRTPSILRWLYPSIVWRMSGDEKDLYLTFDDGPVTGPTEFVLDQARRASIPVTFFCIGDNIRKHPQIFSQITAHGHTVGNHTVNHVNGWSVPSSQYISNVRAFDAVAQEGGLAVSTRLFRPPYGRITAKQIKDLNDLRIVMWDVLSQDYDKRLSPEQCLRRTIKACRPGSIVVFHDSYKAQRNMEYTLPRLIDHFGGLGFNFKGVPLQ